MLGQKQTNNLHPCRPPITVDESNNAPINKRRMPLLEAASFGTDGAQGPVAIGVIAQDA